MKNNMEIRNKAKSSGVYLWEVAAECGINDSNFSRKLRNELPQNEKDAIIGIIDRLAQRKEEVR